MVKPARPTNVQNAINAEHNLCIRHFSWSETKSIALSETVSYQGSTIIHFYIILTWNDDSVSNFDYRMIFNNGTLTRIC